MSAILFVCMPILPYVNWNAWSSEVGKFPHVILYDCGNEETDTGWKGLHLLGLSGGQTNRWQRTRISGFHEKKEQLIFLRQCILLILSKQNVFQLVFPKSVPKEMFISLFSSVWYKGILANKNRVSLSLCLCFCVCVWSELGKSLLTFIQIPMLMTELNL